MKAFYASKLSVLLRNDLRHNCFEIECIYNRRDSSDLVEEYNEITREAIANRVVDDTVIVRVLVAVVADTVLVRVLLAAVRYQLAVVLKQAAAARQ